MNRDVRIAFRMLAITVFLLILMHFGELLPGMKLVVDVVCGVAGVLNGISAVNYFATQWAREQQQAALAQKRADMERRVAALERENFAVNSDGVQTFFGWHPAQEVARRALGQVNTDLRDIYQLDSYQRIWGGRLAEEKRLRERKAWLERIIDGRELADVSDILRSA